MRFPRSSGVLLHPTSLPGPHGSGDLGPAAYHFVDWLIAAGQKVWQMLPLGPVGMGNSPYMSLSAFAGNPLLIDLQELVSRGWLNPSRLDGTKNFAAHRVMYTGIIQFRMGLLQEAAARFFQKNSKAELSDYGEFCSTNALWLDDYALFCALNDQFGGKVWTRWDTEYALRRPRGLARAAADLKDRVDFHKFTQWCFRRQWSNLKKYANDRGIMFVGDIPIFVAHHSADVWSDPAEYHLDERGNPTVVAGVPPDYFSITGQRWGNPLYHWDVMEKNKYRWWVERFRRTLELVDVLRIDHFRGFVAYWEIPAAEKTAEKGRWVEGPGARVFKAVNKKLGKLPIIAEDLGLITPEVGRLRDEMNFPGMKVLQFAFADGTENAFLPHNFASNCVVYSGTHDNDTTQGWYRTATERERDFVRRYTRSDARDIQWDFVRIATQSVADLCIFPFQDVLGLDSAHRMNLPGTSTGNWEWRFTWEMVKPHHAATLLEYTALSARCAADRLSLPTYPDGKHKP